MCLHDTREQPCPKCGSEVYYHHRLTGADFEHCSTCWRGMSTEEQERILVIKRLAWNAANRIRKESKAAAQRIKNMNQGEEKLTCGKCSRTMRRNDTYCPFCKGEKSRFDTPELRKLEQITKVAYAANKAYSETLGEHLPEWSALSHEDRLRRVEGVKWRSENQSLTLRDLHTKWVERMTADGWSYGETKSTKNKLHPCMVDYDELPPHQQLKDALFASLVQVFTRPLMQFEEKQDEAAR